MSRSVREITAELYSTGLNADQFALVTELAVAAASDASGGRSKHAQAQARYRAKPKGDEVIISDHSDHQIPPQHILPPQENSKPKRVSRSIAIDVPQQPTDEARAFARSKGWDDQRTDGEWQRFRDHSLSKGKKHKGELGLGAAWRNWVTSPYQANGESNGKPRSSGNIVDASRRLEQRIKQWDEPPPGGDLCDRARDPDVRLLSKG